MTHLDTTKPPGIVFFYRWLWKYWKARRFQRFIQAINPTADQVLLDLGGYPIDWWGRGNFFGKVDVLNLELASMVAPPPGSPELCALQGDARKLDLPDASYDIIFPKSHVAIRNGCDELH